jgi:hypothetical protein
MQNLHKYLIAYIVSTVIFIIGHSWYLGWDFSVYVLNAKYWFANGQYFEIERAPMMSLIIGLLSFFGWTFAEYLYLIIISALFAYSCYVFSKSVKVNEISFYLLSLNVFVLIYGLSEGTELLSLVFIQLFIAMLIKNKWYSGLFLGLACLTRYNLIIFVPLLLFHKGIKNKINSFILFSVPFIPWFFYNKVNYGNIFFSIADSYALNVAYRYYVPITLEYFNFILAWNLLIPFALIGIFYLFYKDKLKHKKWILITYFLLAVYSLYSLKSNIVRYFILISPIGAFLATQCFDQWKKFGEKIVVILFVIGVILFPVVFAHQNLVKVDYNEIVDQLNLTHGCAIKSNVWVRLNYAGKVSSPFPHPTLIEQNIKEGYYVFFQYESREPAYIENESFMEQFPVVFQSEEYILLGHGCVKEMQVVDPYLDTLNERLDRIYNYTVSEDPCEILMKGLRICYIVNDIFAV